MGRNGGGLKTFRALAKCGQDFIAQIAILERDTHKHELKCILLLRKNEYVIKWPTRFTPPIQEVLCQKEIQR